MKKATSITSLVVGIVLAVLAVLGLVYGVILAVQGFFAVVPLILAVAEIVVAGLIIKKGKDGSIFAIVVTAIALVLVILDIFPLGGGLALATGLGILLNSIFVYQILNIIAYVVFAGVIAACVLNVVTKLLK